MTFNPVAWKDLSKAEKIMAFVLVLLVVSFFTFIENWLLMIFIGSLHSFINFIPALSFWNVLLFNFLIALVIRVVRKLYVKPTNMF